MGKSAKHWLICKFNGALKESELEINIINCLITEITVVAGKSQTEASPYWLSDSEVNMVGRGLRFSRNHRMFEVIKLFIIWHKKQSKKAKASAAEGITSYPIEARASPLSARGHYGRIMPYNSVTVSQLERANTRLVKSRIHYLPPSGEVKGEKRLTWLRTPLSWPEVTETVIFEGTAAMHHATST